MGDSKSLKVISSLGGRFGNICFRALCGKYLADQLGYPFVAVFDGVPVSSKIGLGESYQYYKNIRPWFSNINIDLKLEWNQYSSQALKDRRAGAFESIPVHQDSDIIIGGARHSPRYWNDDKSWALATLRSIWDDQIYRDIHNLYGDIGDCIGVHVRRSDFLSLGIGLPKEYYFKALDLLNLKNSRVLIVSDDLEWCKATFMGSRFVFADRKGVNLQYPEYLLDFYLLRLCKHVIVSNSTFSWWAAYLNETPGRKVMYPWPWTTWATEDFIPKNDNWIKIVR